MNTPVRKKAKIAVAVLGSSVVCLAIALLLPGRLGWAMFEVQRALFPEQKPESHIYDATAKGPVNLASFVRELRTAWPDQGIAVVHDAACEVATGLLHHSDIEVGSFERNKFVPWRMQPWDAAQKIGTELRSMSDFLQDESRYAFRRK